MSNTGKLQITTPSEREIAMTRVFDAPRGLVFDAWTKPELKRLVATEVFDEPWYPGDALDTTVLVATTLNPPPLLRLRSGWTRTKY